MKLGDFGLTMSMKQEVAISPVGTVEYMAPEVPHLSAHPAYVGGEVCHAHSNIRYGMHMPMDCQIHDNFSILTSIVIKQECSRS